MITITTKFQPVYRAKGRKGRLTRYAAYRDAAWKAWWSKHPCECTETDTCEQHFSRDPQAIDEGGDGYTDYWYDKFRADRLKVINRLARWLVWRDTKSQWSKEQKKLPACQRDVR